MDTNKLDYINDYFFKQNKDHFLYLVLHSLFNCLTEEEITVLYFEYARGNPDLKKTIESYIVKRTTNEPKRQFDKIARNLLREYPNQDYHTQTTTRTFTSQFIRTVPKTTIKQFYELLIKSDRKFDRYRASQVADLIWDDEVEGDLLDNFHKYPDEYSLIPLLDNLTANNLCRLMEQHWQKNFPSARLKSKIVKKISYLPLDQLEFLKDIDTSFYIQVLTIRKEKISEKVIKHLLKSLNEDNQYFLVWSLGLTGNWALTTKYIDKLKRRKTRMTFR